MASFPSKASRVMRELREDQKNQFVDEKDLSLLHVYFKDKAVVQYNQDVIYTIEDLIAAFGGLAGLCTGLSLLSVAEFVYFFTLRWGLQLCRENKYNYINFPANLMHNEFRELKIKRANSEDALPYHIQVMK